MEDPKSGPLIRNYIPLTSGNGVPTLEEFRRGSECAHLSIKSEVLNRNAVITYMRYIFHNCDTFLVELYRMNYFDIIKYKKKTYIFLDIFIVKNN